MLAPIPSDEMEEIRTPLAVIRRLLANNQSSSDTAVQDHFKAALDGKWEQVPLLNAIHGVEQLRPGSLVRFRCMVQNMYDPEWYLGEYDHVHTTTGQRVRVYSKYTDSVDVPDGFTPDMSNAVAKTMERIPVHCMSIPHEAAWVMSADSVASVSTESVAQRAKRTHDDAMEDECNVPEDAALVQSRMNCDSCVISEEAKRSRGGGMARDAAAAAGAAGGRPELVPGASRVKHAAIVKVYQEDLSVKVNEAYEFVGVYCLDPVAEAACEHKPSGMCLHEADAVLAATEAAGPASSSTLPRIHAVAFRALTAAWNPALEALAPAQQAAKTAEVSSALPALRARVVRSLASALMGDGLAAEYLLCHMLSRVYHRAQGVPVGKLSLAITGLPASAAGAASVVEELRSVIQGLRPAVAYVPMSVKHLSAKPMAPKKDYSTEMLHTGELQMMASTQVLCDETRMETGQLNETGVKNLHCLQQLATFQHIIFDFSFYQMDFPTDVPVLVTAQGKPLLKTDMAVKLAPDEQACAAVRAELAAGAASGSSSDEEVQQLCRIYFGLARATDVVLSDDLCRIAEEHFVQARKADATVDQDSLGRWLTVAKLLAASYGSTSVQKEHWNQMLAMEAQRMARVAA